MATLPNMWERTLTIGSAGKTFSSTGLKLGWTIGPQHLIRPCQISHQVISIKTSNQIERFIFSFLLLGLCLYMSNIIPRSSCTLF
jgi:aspartate/methionine/tyrosine aminotransferase